MVTRDDTRGTRQEARPFHREHLTALTSREVPMLPQPSAEYYAPIDASRAQVRSHLRAALVHLRAAAALDWPARLGVATGSDVEGAVQCAERAERVLRIGRRWGAR
jgi:hypothetical protein